MLIVFSYAIINSLFSNYLYFNYLILLFFDFGGILFRLLIILFILIIEDLPSIILFINLFIII